MDIIEINNLRLRTFIGFSSHELDAPQDVIIDLRIGNERGLAGETDKPEDAFNYRTVSKAVIALATNSRFQLLEKLAEEIARALVLDFAAEFVAASVYKPGALRHSDSVGITIERRPQDYARNIVYLCLGSNIEPEKNLVSAIRRLRQQTSLLAISPVYRTAPRGFADQPPFLNMAAKAHTLRSPQSFKAEVIDSIETAQGRTRDPDNRNAPRTIDIDIALWNDEARVYGKRPWHIPDPDILRFAHVAAPLADLAPDYQHPIAGRSLLEIAAGLERTEMRQIAIDFP